MSKWKTFALLFLTALLLVPTLTLPIRAADGARSTQAATSLPVFSADALSAQSAILIEADSGRVVCEKQGDLKLPMASTTKIMTALVALELASSDTLITVSPQAVGVEGSSVYLTEGEKLTLEALLYALLLESANDAAAAIAIGLCGSVEAFAEKMNQKASELGLQKTHFTNPHGLHDENHYTTARELAIIARYALQDPLFRTIVATRKATIPHATPSNVRLLINHNKLLRLYDGCIGIKTGFTRDSGRCLVSAAERDGVTLIAVTLRAPNDWDDHISLFDYGFSRFTSVLLCDTDTHLYPLDLVNGQDAYVMVGNREAKRITLPIGHGEIRHTVEMRRFEFAPVSSGDILGHVVYRCDTDQDGTEEILASVPLTARYAVEVQKKKSGFWAWLRSLFGF